MPGWNEYPISNSLFADAYNGNQQRDYSSLVSSLVDSSGTYVTYVAKIAYGRHLQNLDTLISGIGTNLGDIKSYSNTDKSASSIRALQIADIDFKGQQDIGRYKRWNFENAYGGDYRTNNQPYTFTPITNQYLLKYNGVDKTIKNLPVNLTDASGIDKRKLQGAGLFETLGGPETVTLANITLENPQIVADGVEDINIGAFAGQVNSAATLQNLTLQAPNIHATNAKNANVGGMIGKCVENVTLQTLTLENPNIRTEDEQAANHAANVGGIIGLSLNSVTANGLTLENLSLNDTAAETIGGVIGNAGTSNASADTALNLSNVQITNPKLSGGTATGGVIGKSERSATLNNTTVSNAIISGAANMGGVIGQATNGVTVNGDTKLENLSISNAEANAIGGVIGNAGTTNETATTATLNLSGVEIVNPKLLGGTGTATGGVIGKSKATADATLSSVQLYMSDTSYKEKKLDAVLDDWLVGGRYAGGLIGYAEGNVIINGGPAESTKPSFAATVVNATAAGTTDKPTYAGGLAGYVEGALNVDYAWADCYVKANTTDAKSNAQEAFIGGLAGHCGENSTFEHCYAAGFVVSNIRSAPEGKEIADYLKTTAQPMTAAGFAPNKVKSVKNAYSIFNFDDPTLGITGTTVKQPAVLKFAVTTANPYGRPYGIAPEVNDEISVNEKAVYAYGGNALSDTGNKTRVIARDTLKSKKIDDSFKTGILSTTTKYDLLDDTLEIVNPYPYPTLTGQDTHYNDYLVTNQKDLISVTIDRTKEAQLTAALSGIPTNDANKAVKEKNLIANYLSHSMNAEPPSGAVDEVTVNGNSVQAVNEVITSSRRANGERFIGWYTEEQFLNYKKYLAGLLEDLSAVKPVQYWTGSAPLNADHNNKEFKFNEKYQLLFKTPTPNTSTPDYDATDTHRLYAVYESAEPFEVAIENRYYNADRMQLALRALLAVEKGYNPLLNDISESPIFDTNGKLNDTLKNILSNVNVERDPTPYAPGDNIPDEKKGTRSKVVLHTGLWDDTITGVADGDGINGKTLNDLMRKAFMGSQLSQPRYLTVDATDPAYNPGTALGTYTFLPFSMDVVTSIEAENGKLNTDDPETAKLPIQAASYCARFDENGNFLEFAPIQAVTLAEGVVPVSDKDLNYAEYARTYAGQNFTHTEVTFGKTAIKQDQASTYVALYQDIPFPLTVEVEFKQTEQNSVQNPEMDTNDKPIPWENMEDLNAALASVQNALNGNGTTKIKITGALGESILDKKDQITFEGFHLASAENFIILSKGSNQTKLHYERNPHTLSYDFNSGIYYGPVKNGDTVTITGQSFRASNSYYQDGTNSEKTKEPLYGQTLQTSTMQDNDTGTYTVHYLPTGDSDNTKAANTVSRKGYDFNGWEFYASTPGNVTAPDTEASVPDTETLTEDETKGLLARLPVVHYRYDSDGYLLDASGTPVVVQFTETDEPPVDCYVKKLNNTGEQFQLFRSNGNALTYNDQIVTLGVNEPGRTLDTFYKHTYKTSWNSHNVDNEPLTLGADNYLYSKNGNIYTAEVYFSYYNIPKCKVKYQNGTFYYEYTVLYYGQPYTETEKVPNTNDYSVTPSLVTVTLTGGHKTLSEYQQKSSTYPLEDSKGYLIDAIGHVQRRIREERQIDQIVRGVGRILYRTPVSSDPSNLVTLNGLADKQPLTWNDIAGYSSSDYENIPVYHTVLRYDGTPDYIATTLNKVLVTLNELKMPDFDVTAKALWTVQTKLPVRLEIYIQRETDDWRMNTTVSDYTKLGQRPDYTIDTGTYETLPYTNAGTNVDLNILANKDSGTLGDDEIVVGKYAQDVKAENGGHYNDTNRHRMYDFYKEYKIDEKQDVTGGVVTINGYTTTNKNVTTMMQEFKTAAFVAISNDKYLANDGSLKCKQLYLNTAKSNLDYADTSSGEAVYRLYFDRNVVTFKFDWTTGSRWDTTYHKRTVQGLYEAPLALGDWASIENLWYVYAIDDNRNQYDSNNRVTESQLTVLGSFYFQSWQDANYNPNAANVNGSMGLYLTEGNDLSVAGYYDNWGNYHPYNDYYYWPEDDNNARDTVLSNQVTSGNFLTVADSTVTAAVETNYLYNWDGTVKKELWTGWDNRNDVGSKFLKGRADSLSLNNKLTGYKVAGASTNPPDGTIAPKNTTNNNSVTFTAESAIYNIREWHRVHFRDILYNVDKTEMQDAYFYNATLKRLPDINAENQDQYRPVSYGDEYDFQGWYTGSNGTGKKVEISTPANPATSTFSQGDKSHTWNNGTVRAYDVDETTHEKTGTGEEYKMGNLPLTLFAYWAPAKVNVTFTLNAPVSGYDLEDGTELPDHTKTSDASGNLRYSATAVRPTIPSMEVSKGQKIGELRGVSLSDEIYKEYPETPRQETIKVKYVLKVKDEAGNENVELYTNPLSEPDAAGNLYEYFYVYYKFDGWYTDSGTKVTANDVITQGEALVGHWTEVAGKTAYHIKCHLVESVEVTEDGNTHTQTQEKRVIDVPRYANIGTTDVMTPPLADNGEFKDLEGYYPVSNLIPYTIQPGYTFDFYYVKGERWQYRVREYVTFETEEGSLELTARNDVNATMAQSVQLAASLNGYQLDKALTAETAVANLETTAETTEITGPLTVDRPENNGTFDPTKGKVVDLYYTFRADKVPDVADVGYMTADDVLAPLRRGSGVPSLLSGKDDSGNNYYMTLTLSYKSGDTEYAVIRSSDTSEQQNQTPTIATGKYEVTATLELRRTGAEDPVGTWTSPVPATAKVAQT